MVYVTLCGSMENVINEMKCDSVLKGKFNDFKFYNYLLAHRFPKAIQSGLSNMSDVW